MTGKSLRLRLITGGAAAIVVALSFAGLRLSILFERHITRTLVEDLEIHLKQLLAGIEVDPSDHLIVARPPADSRFADPLSGLYWQIGDDHGQLVRSRSVWDTTLAVPVDRIEPGEVHFHETTGPAGTRLMIIERRISLIVGGQLVPIRAIVGIDLARVSAAGNRVR